MKQIRSSVEWFDVSFGMSNEHVKNHFLFSNIPVYSEVISGLEQEERICNKPVYQVLEGPFYCAASSLFFKSFTFIKVGRTRNINHAPRFLVIFSCIKYLGYVLP